MTALDVTPEDHAPVGTEPTRLDGRSWRGDPIRLHIRGDRIHRVEDRPDVGPGDSSHALTLLPALHDHHVHVRSTVARTASLDVSHAPDPATFAALVAAAGDSADGSGIRVVGYDETRHGDLDAHRLDRLIPPDRPVRVQHRSGHQWVLNSVAMRRLRAGGRALPADGVLWDADDAIRGSDRPTRAPADGVRRFTDDLHRRGVVAIDDLTPTATDRDVAELTDLLGPSIDLTAFGAPNGGRSRHGVKLVVAEHSPVAPERLVSLIAAVRPRPVAVHCVTAASLVTTILAFADDFRDGDRIEHAFETPPGAPELAARLLGARGTVRIGVQPGFLRSHGDRHAQHGHPDDVVDYLRLRSWVDGGATLLGGTDSPFGPRDPWAAMQSAVERRTETGLALGPDEALTPEAAFTLFTRDGLTPAGPTLDLRAGDRADVCMVRQPWRDLRTSLERADVAATMHAGRLVRSADPSPAR